MMSNGMRRAVPDHGHIVADSGAMLEQPRHAGDMAVTAVVARLGSLRQSEHRFAFWLQLRGDGRAESKEGSFCLRRGDWIAFDAESMPEIQADRDGIAIGLLLPPSYAGRNAVALDYGLFPGRGRMGIGDGLLAFRLWRAYAAGAHEVPARATRPLLLHLRELQQKLRTLVDHCPGRTMARRSQVLVRMQRARMLQEGNTHRSVRLAEMAETSRFSECWVSKSYHAIYGESVQQASIRMRMERVRELLETTSLSIGELGETCGFNDPCSFARLFKAWHGQTASQWRTRNRNRAGGAVHASGPRAAQGRTELDAGASTRR